jgi:hypothetical protein
VPQKEHVGPDEEKARYDRHTNQIHDPGYRAFLSRVLDPLRQQISPPALGLDFGCGPGPALVHLFINTVTYFIDFKFLGCYASSKLGGAICPEKALI